MEKQQVDEFLTTPQGVCERNIEPERAAPDAGGARFVCALYIHALTSAAGQPPCARAFSTDTEGSEVQASARHVDNRRHPPLYSRQDSGRTAPPPSGSCHPLRRHPLHDRKAPRRLTWRTFASTFAVALYLAMSDL